MGRSRRCCCCLDWIQNNPVRLEPPSSSRVPWTFGAISPGFGGGNARSTHLDAKAEAVYAVLLRTSPAAAQVWKLDHDTRQKTLLFEKSASYDLTIVGHAVCVVPREQKLVYCYAPLSGGLHSANVINYDGTGDTTLFTFPTVGAGSNSSVTGYFFGGPSQMACDHAGGLVFIGLVTTPGVGSRKARIYSFSTTASSPTMIWEATVSAGDSNYIGVLDFDRIHQKLLFLFGVNPTVATGTSQVWRCDADGGNLEMLADLKAEGHAYTAARVSYADECIYSYDWLTNILTTDTGAGFHRRDFNFNKLARIWKRTTNLNTPTAGFDLGCGFEKLGPTYKGF